MHARERLPCIASLLHTFPHLQQRVYSPRSRVSRSSRLVLTRITKQFTTMSASPIARQATQSQSIPSKRIVIHDPNQLPADYSSTPGGTLYSTTPGGTRIVYERAFLMNLRNSPISRTPPQLCSIPVDLLKSAPAITDSNSLSPCSQVAKDIPVIEEASEQFEMDM